MRGRDHGLPGYQTVRTALGLSNVTDWENINPSLYKKDPMVSGNLFAVCNCIVLIIYSVVIAMHTISKFMRIY